MWFLVLSVALAANKWEGHNADITASRTVAAQPSQIYSKLLDIRTQADLIPAACAEKWYFGDVTQGVGASASVVYRAAAMHRKLTATLSKVDPDRRITLDHPGNKGFITTWEMKAGEDGTRVELHTYLNQPPWPVRGYFYKRVQPAWTSCHEQTLEKLAQQFPG